MKYVYSILFIGCFLNVVCAQEAMQSISYVRMKYVLGMNVYPEKNKRVTLYCQARFDADGTLFLPDGFTTEKYVQRAQHLEWEHVVPVENFGKTFTAWREGHELCVDKKGKTYKGRRCATKMSAEFRAMQADIGLSNKNRTKIIRKNGVFYTALATYN